MIENFDAKEQLERFLQAAVEGHASDLHLEPYADHYRVRLRVDGGLLILHEGPLDQFSSLMNRLKVLCKMDIAERRKTQDGGFRVSYDEVSIDFRVSVVPVMDGEKAAIRILDHTGIDLHYQSLGFTEKHWSDQLHLVERKSGLLLLSGPTGSGKTTTLYTLLTHLNREDRHIITLEDPIEYRIRGVNQIQVNEKTGLTFSSGLRAVLRQDPQIIMVGEIRDRETAEIAVRAAITGHLVLSTLHTNDSHTAVIRLRDMGIEPYLIAASLIGVSSQRLVKKLCSHCRREISLDPLKSALYRSVGLPTLPTSVYEAVGCPKCRGGYGGRVAIAEVLPITECLREGIVNTESLRQLRDRSPEFRPMVLDGLEKIGQGITDHKEVFGALHG